MQKMGVLAPELKHCYVEVAKMLCRDKKLNSTLENNEKRWGLCVKKGWFEVIFCVFKPFWGFLYAQFFSNSMLHRTDPFYTICRKEKIWTLFLVSNMAVFGSEWSPQPSHNNLSYTTLLLYLSHMPSLTSVKIDQKGQILGHLNATAHLKIGGSETEDGSSSEKCLFSPQFPTIKVL